jgi:multiple sugar transport system permease protein
MSAAREATGGGFLRREMSAGWFTFFMNLPTLLCIALVLAYPVAYAGYLSFHRVRLAELRRGEFPFYGVENYVRLFEDRLFWLALKNTFVFTGITVVAEVVLAVLIALLINQQSIWTSRVTRFLILLPYAIPPIANGLIWSFLYSFQFGFLNRILFALGAINEPINWSGNPETALYAVTVPYIWRTLPFAILLVHAALQGIPRELYEQAAVDGGTAWHRFRHITLPLLNPQISMVAFIHLVAFQAIMLGVVLVLRDVRRQWRRHVQHILAAKNSICPPCIFEKISLNECKLVTSLNEFCKRSA